MDKAVEAVLAEYDKRGAEESKLRQTMSEDEETRRRDDFLLSIGPYTGRLLNTLIKGSKARNILEIGTSYGHSTVFLAEAARATGGRVITIDCAANKPTMRARCSQKRAWRNMSSFVWATRGT